MEGDDKACKFGEYIARNLDAVSVRLSPEQRNLTHLAMTVTSNYMVSVIHMAEEIMMSAGISNETAQKMLMPLYLNTAHNISASGTLNALTGPVSRGDITILTRHLDTLASIEEEYQIVYKGLARIALRMAVKRGDVTRLKAEEIKKMLTNPDYS